MLEISGLHAGYDRTMVLRGIDLSLTAGERVGILGRNGVGKTTLLKTVMGLVTAAEGTIALNGQHITHARTHARARSGISYVPQGRLVFPGLTVEDNLRAAIYAMRAHEADRIVADAFEEFPILRDRRAATAGSLSGGQQQMLALARALVTQPTVLLLDEPSEGIQPSIVEQIAERIRTLNADRGITILLVEQNLDFATEVTETSYVLDKGRLVRQVPSSRVLEDTELLREYLGV